MKAKDAHKFISDVLDQATAKGLFGNINSVLMVRQAMDVLQLAAGHYDTTEENFEPQKPAKNGIGLQGTILAAAGDPEQQPG